MRISKPTAPSGGNAVGELVKVAGAVRVRVNRHQTTSLDAHANMRVAEVQPHGVGVHFKCYVVLGSLAGEQRNVWGKPLASIDDSTRWVTDDVHQGMAYCSQEPLRGDC